MTFILFKGGQNTDLIKRILTYLPQSLLIDPNEQPLSPPEDANELVSQTTNQSLIEPNPIVPLQPKPTSIFRVTRSSLRGGAINNKLLELLKLLPPISKDNKGEDSDSDIDVFKNSSICFHPLLPIYMITQAYMISINNESIQESLDADLFINYLNFLKKIKENVVNIYSGVNNNNEKKLEAYVIGICLRQLLFISNNDNNGYQDCLKALGTDDLVYSKVSSYTESLAYNISGKITFDDYIIQQGPVYLNSDFFSDFAHGIDVNSIFSNNPNYDSFNEQTFRSEVLDFSVEIAQQIMSDRGIKQTIVPVISEPTSIITTPDTPIGIQGITSKERQQAIEAQKERVQKRKKDEDVAKGITKESKLKPFDPSRRMGSEIFTYSDGDESNMVYTSSSSKKSRRVGGKKKKTLKKNRKSYKNKTNKHRRKHRKTRRIKT